MTWYKFLAGGAVGQFSGYRWPTPQGADAPGSWVVAAGRLDPCRTGLHVCNPGDLPLWMAEELYTVEVDGRAVEYDGFALAHRARLLRRVEVWDQDLAGRFSRECAVRVRDLAVDALRDAGRAPEADRLARCGSTEQMLSVARQVDEAEDEASRLAGYVADAARFATAVRSKGRWAAATATVAFVAATAARVAAPPGTGQAAMRAERVRQGLWLGDHVLATV